MCRWFDAYDGSMPGHEENAIDGSAAAMDGCRWFDVAAREASSAARRTDGRPAGLRLGTGRAMNT